MIRPQQNDDQASVQEVRRRRRFIAVRIVAAVSVCALFLVLSMRATADDSAVKLPTLSGTWSASALSESWNTSDWGDACGPKPKGGGAAGGTVTVTETGSELLFQGAGMAYSTASCFEAMPGLKRTSHSGGKRGWSSTCASPAGDSRRATIKTSISATDDTIGFSEVGVFEFVIDGTTCKATMSRARSFKLKERAGAAVAPEPTTPPPPEPAPTASAATPTPAPPSSECDPEKTPARFEFSPARKLMRPGETFAFRATVFDGKGCRLAVTPDLTIDGAVELVSRSTMKGLELTLASDAPAGALEVVASLAGETVRASVEVTPVGSYDDLLRARGLDAHGEDARTLTATIATSLGSRGAQARDEQGSNRVAFVAAGVGVASLLAIAALVLARRGRRAAPEVESESAPAPAVAFFDARPDTLRICATCDATYPETIAFCEKDGTPLVPIEGAPDSVPRSARPAVASVLPQAPVPASPPGTVCPACGDLYPKETRFCGRDGSELMPING